MYFAHKIFFLLVFGSPNFLVVEVFNTTAKLFFFIRNHFDVLTSYKRSFQLCSLNYLLNFHVTEASLSSRYEAKESGG